MRVINVEIKAYCRDRVEGPGEFIEVEARGAEGDVSEEYLREQCSCLITDFGIEEKDLIHASYSDLLIRK